MAYWKVQLQLNLALVGIKDSMLVMLHENGVMLSPTLPITHLLERRWNLKNDGEAGILSSFPPSVKSRELSLCLAHFQKRLLEPTLDSIHACLAWNLFDTY